jgi:glycosyltransferase involved in cell wall biosynthesis
MRILMLTPGFPPLVGGGERYACALAEHLVRQGHQVTVVTSAARQVADLSRGAPAAPADEAASGGLRVVRLAVRPMVGGRAGLHAWRKAMVLLSQLPGDQTHALCAMARRIPGLIGLAEALPTLGPHDLVHVFNLSWEYPAVIGWRHAREQGLPLALTPFMHLGRGRASREARNSTMDHQRHLLREADAVLTLTTVEREQLLALGAPQERVHVVGAGLSAPHDDRAIEAACAPVNIQPLPRPYALFIGRLSRDKGAIVAAEAVRRLRRRGRDISLVLVGERAPEFERWERRLRHQPNHGILALSGVSESLKQALLARAEMLLLPSVVESFGLVFLEAWSHAKPVIGANAGGIPGVVRHGENGLLVPPGDALALAAAIAQLLDDAALARRLGEAGRDGLAEYTWERVCARTLAAYQQAVEAMRS